MDISVADYARECAEQGMRGDYSVCRPDFTVAQDYSAYKREDQEVWKTLSERQAALTRRLAHRSYLAGIEALGLMDRVPDLDEVSGKLERLTGWRLVAVPGLIPADAFFKHLAARRFPVTNWLRRMDELDYIVEPDMFHDFFGHVPILTQPDFADFMQLYGETAQSLIRIGGDEMITRLYWYTSEFGLIQEDGQPLKAFGAGLMSSRTELTHAVEADGVRRVPFDLETVMRTGYEIDKFQKVYFVLASFDALKSAVETVDMAAIVKRYRDDEPIDPETL